MADMVKELANLLHSVNKPIYITYEEMAEKLIENGVTIVEHGKWEKDTTVRVMAPSGQAYHYRCSKCGYITRLHNQNRCPNCGAKMDKEWI